MLYGSLQFPIRLFVFGWGGGVLEIGLRGDVPGHPPLYGIEQINATTHINSDNDLHRSLALKLLAVLQH